MPQKVDFENYDSILNNFDAFCDAFEEKAVEAFQRGDTDNGRVIRAATEALGGVRGESESNRESDNIIQAPESE